MLSSRTLLLMAIAAGLFDPDDAGREPTPAPPGPPLPDPKVAPARGRVGVTACDDAPSSAPQGPPRTSSVVDEWKAWERAEAERQAARLEAKRRAQEEAAALEAKRQEEELLLQAERKRKRQACASKPAARARTKARRQRRREKKGRR